MIFKSALALAAFPLSLKARLLRRERYAISLGGRRASMHSFNVPPDVRDWLESEANFKGISLDRLIAEYLTEAVLDRKKAAAKVVRLPVTGNGGKHD